MALCSASSNPLTQFTKHIQTDRALQRDRLVHSHNGTGHQGFRTGRNQHNQPVEEFARFNASSSNLVMPDHGTPHRQPNFELHPSPQSSNSYTSGQAWTSEFGRNNYGIHRTLDPQAQLYHSEEKNMHRLQRQPRVAQDAGRPGSLGNHMMGTIRHDYPSTSNSWQFQQDTRSGMGLAAHLSTRPEQTHLPPINLEKTMEDFDWDALFASLDTTTRVIDGHGDFVTSTIQESCAPEALVDDQTAHLSAEPITDQIPDFIPEDIALNNDHGAFERGMQIVRQDDNLSLAVVAFEEACRADPMHFEAWKMLGSVLAEVEREATAILAFNEALKLEPNNLDVIMRLAVSYTNEGSQDLACQCLEQWMRIKYPQVSIPEFDSQTTNPSHSELFERIKDPFIQAARLSLQEEVIDADVQVGLGVLMFSAELYQMAADCFHAAIESTEPKSIRYQTQQHLLWNRYAACLGNVRGKETMAIQAYETALALKPNFVKARCNLGVVYHNINQPLMGARNILEALVWNRSLEVKVREGRDEVSDDGTSEMTGDTTDHDDTMGMYETLMRCCNSMCRWDLAELVRPGMDFQEFKIKLDAC